MEWTSTINTGDLGYMFRMQKARSLHDLDQLIQLKCYISGKLGAQKAQEIESDVTLYSDAEQFRKYHAVGRFRGILTAGFLTTVTFTGMNGWKNGMGSIQRQPFLAGAFFATNFLVWYQVWSRGAGYSEQKFYEF